MKQTITKLVSRLNYYASSHHIWPELDYELLDFKRRGMLSGKVLNAGAGWRKLDHLVEGELVNQDIKWPEDQRTHIHVFSPIHQIPVQDNTFDMIVCLAVLEHVENPTEIVKEFLRFSSPGGIALRVCLFCNRSTNVLPTFKDTPAMGWSIYSRPMALRS